MTQALKSPYAIIALVFVGGMVVAVAAAASIRLIFSEAPTTDLITAIVGLFGVPLGVVMAGRRTDDTRNYLLPAVLLLSVCWTVAVIGVIVVFDLRALPYRQNPAECPCSLGDLTDLVGKQFPKANAVLSLVLGGIFASSKDAKATTPHGGAE